MASPGLEVGMKRRTTWLLGTTIPVGVILILVISSPREPTYQKHPLGHWLSELEKGDTRDRAARTAIQSIGTNAVPTLLDWIGQRERIHERLLRETLEKTQMRLPARFDANRRRYLAAVGFEVLGSRAESAVPELQRMLTDSDIALEAALALAWIQPESVQETLSGWTVGTNRMDRIRSLRLQQEIIDHGLEREE